MWQLLAERGWGKAAEFVAIEEQDSLEMSKQEEDAIVAAFKARMNQLAARRAAREKAIADGPRLTLGR